MRIGIVTGRDPVVKRLVRLLNPVRTCSIAWIAGDRVEARRKFTADTPDLVLMDLHTEGLDGVRATSELIASAPKPILLVTDSIVGNAALVFEAMGCGALDVVALPGPEPYDEQGAGKTLEKKIAMISRLAADGGDVRRTAGRKAGAAPDPFRPTLVAIGASAGGPAALAEVLAGLPPDFPGAIVIVQHVGEQFTAGMAWWLSQRSSLPVRTAREGDVPEAGTVLIAGTNHHLVMRPGDRIGYAAEPDEHPYRPSIDVLFQSVNRHWTGNVIGVLLTGMGSDGAAGLRGLRESGHHTIAQDKDTCAVYGMPKAAVALNAAMEILPAASIPRRLVEILSVSQSRFTRSAS